MVRSVKNIVLDIVSTVCALAKAQDTRENFILATSGVFVFIATILFGFLGTQPIERVLIFISKLFFSDEVLYIFDKHPGYRSESWFVMAMSVTLLFSLAFYVTTGRTLLKVKKTLDTHHHDSGIFLTAILLFAAFAIIFGVIFPLKGLSTYFGMNDGNINALEWITLLILVLFCVYDGIIILMCSTVPNKLAESESSEAWRSLLRVDAPIFLSYLVLFLFLQTVEPKSIAKTFHVWSESKHGLPLGLRNQSETMESFEDYATLMLRSFGAGAAAFKLIISNLLFTLLQLQILWNERQVQRASPGATPPGGGQAQ